MILVSCVSDMYNSIICRIYIICRISVNYASTRLHVVAWLVSNLYDVPEYRSPVYFSVINEEAY